MPSRTPSRPPRPTAVRAAAALGTASLLGLLAACAAPADDPQPTAAEAGTITVEHAQGSTEVPIEPEVIVTFDMASLDTLDALGVEVAGVVQANVPSYLQQYAGADYANVGTLFEPDYEAVNALEPDLIIVANRSAETLPELAKIAPTIDLTLDWEDYLGSFRTNVETLASIVGEEEAATAALEEIDARIDEVSAASAEAGDGLIVLTSAGEITAFGPGSRFGWLHEVLGVVPAIEDVEEATHGEPVSAEFLLETDPGHLYVFDRDAAIGESGATAEQILDNELVAQTAAWQNDAVHYLDAETWYIVMSGLQAVDAMIDEVEEAVR